MIKEIMEKVPNGKLLILRVDFDKKINKVEIIGDFFVHPEESIEDIEKSLSKLTLDFDLKKETNILKQFVKENQIQLIGFDEESILNLLKKVITQ